MLFVLLNAIASDAQNENTVLWRINNPSNQQPSYLFGTIHLPQEKFMLLTDSVYMAVLGSSVFYGELNYTTLYSEMSIDDGFFQSKLNYLDSVKKTPNWRRMIAAVNRNYHTSINPDSLDQFNKFSQTLLADYMSAEPGVTGLDIALSKYAITMGKKTKGLETFKFQINMLYKIIDARLTDTTLLFNDDVALAANMKRFYANQQLVSMTPLIETMNLNYRKIVFDTRNRSMADSIQNITVGKTAFFAVGCGHLLGTNGLISLLRSKGLQLTPVFSNNKISITRMESFFGSFNKTIKKEVKKQTATANDEVVPDESIEEIKEDVQMSTVPAKKTLPKKIKNKKS